MSMKHAVTTSMLVLLLSFATCSAASAKAPDEIVHVVLVWLKQPGNTEHRHQIIEASRAFREIPGVVELRVGPPLPSERPVVDDSFDVAIYPGLGFSVAAEAMRQSWEFLKEKGTSAGIAVPQYRNMHELMGFSEVWDFEKKWAQP